jgi:hypothetical protein
MKPYSQDRGSRAFKVTGIKLGELWLKDTNLVRERAAPQRQGNPDISRPRTEISAVMPRPLFLLSALKCQAGGVADNRRDDVRAGKHCNVARRR